MPDHAPDQPPATTLGDLLSLPDYARLILCWLPPFALWCLRGGSAQLKAAAERWLAQLPAQAIDASAAVFAPFFDLSRPAALAGYARCVRPQLTLLRWNGARPPFAMKGLLAVLHSLASSGAAAIASAAAEPGAPPAADPDVGTAAAESLAAGPGRAIGHAMIGHAIGRLEELDISRSAGVTDAIMLPLVGSCGGTLVRVYLTATSVTDHAVAALAEAAGHRLQDLDISLCLAVTDEAILSIAAHCSGLNKLGLGGLERGELSWLTAAIIPMENPDCSCKLTRVRPSSTKSPGRRSAVLAAGCHCCSTSTSKAAPRWTSPPCDCSPAPAPTCKPSTATVRLAPSIPNIPAQHASAKGLLLLL